jgi:hypothetical protein
LGGAVFFGLWHRYPVPGLQIADRQLAFARQPIVLDVTHSARHAFHDAEPLLHIVESAAKQADRLFPF